MGADDKYWQISSKFPPSFCFAIIQFYSITPKSWSAPNWAALNVRTRAFMMCGSPPAHAHFYWRQRGDQPYGMPPPFDQYADWPITRFFWLIGSWRGWQSSSESRHATWTRLTAPLWSEVQAANGEWIGGMFVWQLPEKCTTCLSDTITKQWKLTRSYGDKPGTRK